MIPDLGTAERAVRLALPAVREIALPGWLVRISGGTTKRVNSAIPLDPSATLGPVREEIERLYARQGLPARFRLTPLAAAHVDAELAEADYDSVDPSVTMTTRLSARPVDPAVEIADTVRPTWMEGFANASGWSREQRDAHAAVLGRMPAGAIVATITDDGSAVAFGIGSIAAGTCCLFDIAVVSDRRGQGIGRRLVGSILATAHRRGIGHALLQVLSVNRPARSLYRSLGFVDLFAYHYRVRR